MYNSVSIHHRNIQMFNVKNKMCPESRKSLFHQIPSRRRSKEIVPQAICKQSLQW